MTEELVTLETAKLLKEKGFNEYCKDIIKEDNNRIMQSVFQTGTEMKQVLSFEQMKHLQELGLYHTYTLQDILDKLPCFIGKEVLTIQKLADSYTCLYMEPYSRSMIKITESKELIDAAYDMLCWCIENGYVKVE